MEQKKNRFLFSSLGVHRYLSLISHSKVVIGNSSSGIIEAPFLGKPVVNIGDRQKGRSSSGHVLHVAENSHEIKQAIEKSLDAHFINQLENQSTLYGDGRSASRVVAKFEEIDLSDMIQKEFYDIEFSL